jgi:hypothetical protein
MTQAPARIPASTTLEIPRDHNGWPLVMNQAGTARLKYRRCTKFIDVLEDQFNLERWKQRQIVWGLAQSPDLILQATSCRHPDGDKSVLNGVAWNSMQRARSEAKATTGTALHKLTERLDLGETLGRVPDPHGADLRAYEAAKKRHQLEYLFIESFRVNDGWQVAGTTDRIVKIDGRYYIADIKTGSIDWGSGLKIAMQLAMYRHSVPYDIATDTRGEDPVFIETDKAVIIHLPAGEGKCELHWTNTKKGWEACQTAYKVWQHRSWQRDDIMWPVADQMELGIAPEPLISEERAIMQAGTCNTMEQLKAHYLASAAMGIDSKEFRAAVEARKAYLASAG